MRTYGYLLRSYVGCVAVALGQVINYWQHPQSVEFTDTNRYTTRLHGIRIDQDANDRDFPFFTESRGEDYPSLNQRLSDIKYDGDEDEIAALLFACGVSVEMNYGGPGEGSGADTERCAWALRNIFGYSSAEVKSPAQEDFYDVLQENMANAHPAILAIRRGEEGHAIVVDGFKDTGEYRLNMGWGGRNDWYFLPHGMPEGFNVVRLGIVYILPHQRLDLVFCIDTTGSMGPYIDAAKASAIEIINKVSESIPDFRIAVVDYRDFPVLPYGGSGDYPYNDVIGFTSDKAAANSAIQSLRLGWGADWRESVYSALMHCIDGTSLGGWRPKPIKKAIILMGDAPPHDPEPFTGYTMDDVIQASSNPVRIYPIVLGGDAITAAYFTGLAEGTGGAVFTAATAGAVVEAIMAAIEVITYSPVARAGGPYIGQVGEPILLDASDSYDPDGEIVLYEWDVNNDGVYDYSTSSPTYEHIWHQPYEGRIRLRVTDNDGLVAIDTAEVVIRGMTDIGALVDILVGRVDFDRRTGKFGVNVTVSNISDTAIGTPLWLVMEEISDPAVTLDAFTDTTADGKPYIDLSSLLDAGILAPSDSISLTLWFDNPGRLQFTFTPSICGVALYPDEKDDDDFGVIHEGPANPIVFEAQGK